MACQTARLMCARQSKRPKNKKEKEVAEVYGGGGSRGGADITGATRSSAPGAELYGGTSGILNSARREEGRKEGSKVALLPSCPCPGADGRRPQPTLEIGTGWMKRKKENHCGNIILLFFRVFLGLMI